MKTDADGTRLESLGQVAVLRDRLDRLEQTLVRQSVGYDYKDEATTEDVASVSIQCGVLVGTLSRHLDNLR